MACNPAAASEQEAMLRSFRAVMPLDCEQLSRSI